MADRKEILDYLRNCQKAAEIEAKVNGINLWVLWGAIGVLCWTFLGYLYLDFAVYREGLVRALLCGQAVYFFNWVSSPTHGIREELRYQPWRINQLESPLLVFIEGAWLALPPGLHFWVLGGSWSAVFVGFFGLAMMLAAVLAILREFMAPNNGSGKFPKPNFSLSKKADIAGDVLLGVGFVFVAGTQFWALLSWQVEFSDVVKAIALLVVIYLLLVIAIRKGRTGYSIRWTYELETDVLVGAISPEDAARRIEYRSLGSRFQDVMKNFFDEFDKRFELFEEKIRDSREVLGEIVKVPSEFRAERSSRFEAATVEVRRLLEEMSSDMKELSDYLKTLERKKSDLRVAAAIEDLGLRRDAYHRKFKSAESRLADLKEEALSNLANKK